MDWHKRFLLLCAIIKSDENLNKSFSIMAHSVCVRVMDIIALINLRKVIRQQQQQPELRMRLERKCRKNVLIN